MIDSKLTIIGVGNLGTAIINGLVDAKIFTTDQISLSDKRRSKLQPLRERGFIIPQDNVEAVTNSNTIFIAVEPQQLNDLLQEIKTALDPDRHTIISVVSGVTIRQIQGQIDKPVTIVRAMPNTAIAIRESMTCIATNNGDDAALHTAKTIFDAVGQTLIIKEDEMIAATSLGACGIAFFLRAIRAASQGGIEIGFHADDALRIAAQTAKGAASLVMQMGKHPEHEIDKVTTPRGVTISGLNQMEHEGFSSAMIKGIVTSAEKASKLYENGET